MPATGWYPDPDGTPDRYRFWDGNAWSAATTTDPRQPPPAAGPPTQQRRTPVALLIGVLALIVIVVVAAVMIIRGNPSNRITDQRFPSSSTSGWDDSSPTPTPEPTPSEPPPTPTATPTPNGQVPCPTGDPNARAAHPDDERVYGGNLSFPRVSRFQREAVEPRMTFGYDVTQQVLEVSTDPGWIAQLAVGELHSTDGFTSNAKRAAEQFVECSIGGLMYEQYHPSRTDRQSKAVTISGQPGWMIDTEIRVTEPGLPFAGDHAVFLVIKDGADWGMFFGAAPIGNGQLEAVLQSTIRALRAG